jgi:dihydrofolate reductase
MIKLIVAMDPNQLIGKNNQLPWNIKEDLTHFKETTTGHAVVMGRKTFDSIGRPLPNRVNYILTRDAGFGDAHPDVKAVSNINQLIKEYKDSAQTLFVIGGEQVYGLFLDHCDELIVSHILSFHYGDTYFPEFLNKFKSYKIVPNKGFNVVHYRRIKNV